MQTKHWLLGSALGLALAGPGHAVHLDPGGRGQVLLYPYYTVNNHQQTLLSVINTTGAAQVVKVSFLEGYNGRQVADFKVWLAPYDAWTATVFALEDAGFSSEGAAIRSTDRSCSSSALPPIDGFDGLPYVPFSCYAYIQPLLDGGPTNIARTREGWIEIIAMADVTEPLLSAIMPVDGMPADCGATSDVDADDPGVATKPTGGLIGSAGIVNVSQGTLLATRAEALGGFTGVSLFTGMPSLTPNLGSVNDGVVDGPATAHIFDANGRAQSLTYVRSAQSLPTWPYTAYTRPIDAISAVLMADHLHNEYMVDPGIAATSDWLLTMPTKSFYTDIPLRTWQVVPPFYDRFDRSGAWVNVTQTFYDRNGGHEIECDWGTCPPAPLSSPLRYAVNVLSFSNSVLTASGVLGSALFDYAQPQFYNWMGGMVLPLQPMRSNEGWMQFDLYYDGYNNKMLPSQEGKILRGLPVIGFWATNLVNGAVSNGVLSNYGAAVRHTTSVSCVKASDGTACD